MTDDARDKASDNETALTLLKASFDHGFLQGYAKGLDEGRRPYRALTEEEITECHKAGLDAGHVTGGLWPRNREALDLINMAMGAAVRAALRKADEIRAGGKS